MDAVLERLERLERQMEEGIPAAPWPGNMAGDGASQPCPAVQPQAQSLESREAEPRTVTLPKAQLEDLNLDRMSGERSSGRWECPYGPASGRRW